MTHRNDDLIIAASPQVLPEMVQAAQGPMVKLIEDLAKRCVAYGTAVLDPKRGPELKPHFEMALQNAITVAIYCDKVMKQATVVDDIDDPIARGAALAKLHRILGEEE